MALEDVILRTRNPVADALWAYAQMAAIGQVEQQQQRARLSDLLGAAIQTGQLDLAGKRLTAEVEDQKQRRDLAGKNYLLNERELQLREQQRLDRQLEAARQVYLGSIYHDPKRGWTPGMTWESAMNQAGIPQERSGDFLPPDTQAAAMKLDDWLKDQEQNRRGKEATIAHTQAITSRTASGRMDDKELFGLYFTLFGDPNSGQIGDNAPEFKVFRQDPQAFIKPGAGARRPGTVAGRDERPTANLALQFWKQKYSDEFGLPIENAPDFITYMQNEFQQDWAAAHGGAVEPGAGGQAQIVRTATNPKTGKKVGLTEDGQWVPLN